MKGKILESEFEQGHSSWIIKETKYGTFFGQAFINTDKNLDIENSFDGCRIAEFRCDLQAVKEKSKWMRQRAIGIQHAYNVLKNNFEEDNPALQQLKRQEEIAWRDYYSTRCLYERMKEYEPFYIKNIVEERQKLRKIIEKTI